MRIAVMQPTYLPWLGYFELIDNCDLFVFLDDVQFVRKSWHQRNKIKNREDELLLTVPVLSKGKHGQLIKDTLINNELPWRKKHLGSIRHCYQKAPFYNDYIGNLEEIYGKDYTYLPQLSIRLIELIKEGLGLKTKTILSSQLPAKGARTEKVINICKACNADVLYDAKGAKDILDLEEFRKNNIEIIFQNYKHPVYNQQHGDFISHLSTLDLLFNMGVNSLAVIRSGNVQFAEKGVS